ncbi:hypothetical protein CEXT_600911, partial [Caerostris extrusa]
GNVKNKFIAARRTQLNSDKHPSGSCHFHPKHSIEQKLGSGRGKTERSTSTPSPLSETIS